MFSHKWVKTDTRRWTRVVLGTGVVVLLIAGTALLVYVAGGTRTVYPHFGYLPVILAAYLLGRTGGIVAGVAMGLAVGPAMPVDVVAGIGQETVNWLWRTGFFVLIGFGVGEIVGRLRHDARTIRRLSRREPGTGLHNRVAFLQDLERALAPGNPHQEGGPVSCVVYDLVAYSRLVRGLGHADTDGLMRAVAERVNAHIDPSQVYQLLPDRLASILPRGGSEPTRAFIEKVEASLATPVTAGKLELPVTVRFGSASAERGSGAWILDRNATAALEQARETRRRHVSYDLDIGDTMEDPALHLIADFRRALESGEGLSVAYQPILQLENRECVAVEALVRWSHPRLGPVPPSRLVDLLETAGLTPDLTRWLVRTVAGEIAQWSPPGGPAVAINVSVLDLEKPGLATWIHSALSDARVEASRFGIEVTETALMVNVDGANECLHQLRERGVGVSIDDFGTGQSSLAYLSRLPAGTLKIDRTFVSSILQERRDATITRIAIQLAHELGMIAVAEGVETEAVHAQLAEWGCDRAQGYLYARPMPAPALSRWLSDHH